MLTRASDGLLAKGFPHLSSYRYEPKQKRQGDNIIFARDARSTPSELPAPRQRARPSDDERDRKELLIQDLIAFSGHEQSRGFYARAVYTLESDTIYRAISETEYEHLEGRIQHSKAQVLNSILQRLAHEQGISLTEPEKPHPSYPQLPCFQSPEYRGFSRPLPCFQSPSTVVLVAIHSPMTFKKHCVYAYFRHHTERRKPLNKDINKTIE